MSLSRRISAHRSTVLLVVLVVLSAASLATGTEGSVVTRAVGTAVSVVSYPFTQALHQAANGAHYLTGFFVSYDSARRETAMLREEIGNLTAQMGDYDSVISENRRLRRMLTFERAEPGLTMMPAEVGSRSEKPLMSETISNASGVLIINRGSLQGVKEAMCAMTPAGVVGIVIKVEPTQSIVASLRSDLCKIGAVISRDRRVRGTVHGSGSDYSHTCRMEYLDAKEVVRIGDEVLTLGSGIFPSEYKIGRIVDIDKTGALFQVAYIEPAADPYATDELFLVERAQPKLLELTGTPPSGSTEHLAYAMPDTRSVQDRYAP